MKYDSWSDPSRFEHDPAQIERIMRSPSMVITPIDPYLARVEAALGEDLGALRSATRNALVYQQASEHLATRRLISGFFGERSIAQWQPTLDEAIGTALTQLESAADPDLMHDFVTPLFLSVIARLVGFRDDGSGRLFPMIIEAQRMTEPMLSVRDLRNLNSAILYLLDVLPELREAPRGTPECLLAYLHRKRESGPEGVDLRQSALVLVLAANTAAQTLGLALYGLLMGDADDWQDAARDEWMDRSLDRLLNLYLSTLTLVRTPQSDVEIGGCPYRKNQPAVLDIVAANRALRSAADEDAHGRRQPHLSFGTGAHKCPGEALSRRLIRSAIPVLARRFPRLALHKDKTRFTATPMVQAPVSLPCELRGRSRRSSARLVEIKDIETAREIVNDDAGYGPPRMEPYLRALAVDSGCALDAATRIARNAMFFMSGPRHLTARRAVTCYLGGNRLRQWEDFVDSQVATSVRALENSDIVDLVTDFSDPLGLGIARRILGIAAKDGQRFDRLAPVLQTVQEPWLSMRKLLQLQTVFEELLSLLLLPDRTDDGPGSPLLPALLAMDLPDYDPEDIKALVLVLYGASFNLSHTLANILHWLLIRPPEEREPASSPQWIVDNLERLIALCASPKYIYRMARKPLAPAGIPVRQNDTVRLQLLSVNRNQNEGHLAFGHGLHRCAGAALSRLVLRQAIPVFFQRFPQAALVPQAHAYQDLSQTVALAKLPCRLSAISD